MKFLSRAEARGVVHGRLLFARSKRKEQPFGDGQTTEDLKTAGRLIQYRATSPSNPETAGSRIPPLPTLIDIVQSMDIEKSFRLSAYPSAVEIFKISELLELPRNTIKTEFQKRRRSYRQRHHLSEDLIVRPCTPMFYGLTDYLQKMNLSMLKATILCFALASLWLLRIFEGRSFNGGFQALK